MNWNKKADGEILFIIFLILVFGGFFKAVASNEYTSFRGDCETNEINKEKFSYSFNGTCYTNMFNESTAYSCVKNEVNKERLNLYCQEMYVSFNNKESEGT